MNDPPKIALYYDDDAYVEMLQRPVSSEAGAAYGLMGRQVAGHEFLDAYLSHGTWNELVALTPHRAGAQSLAQTCRTHPSSRHKQRRLLSFAVDDFHDSFLANPPAACLHFPNPPDVRFAWARGHRRRHGFAISGVTHTLCSVRAVEAIQSMLVAPFEPYDRLICTSRAVVDMVRAVVADYTEYLRDRFGGDPQFRPGLATIPLGVNTEKYRPASDAERAAQRRQLKVGDDELLVLFVGRLSHHAKAHPFPMFRGIALAAQNTRKKVHLALVGWAGSPAVRQAFEEGARRFAPGIRTTFLDGMQSENRFGPWKAADVFTSLSDNLQETFGLVVVEAMACGLPVVASDWNGYRDLVVDGETGFLMPTAMMRDATRDATSRLLVGEINYDHFLAECSQCAVVDSVATAGAFARLFADEDLRRRMGAAGRKRAMERFDWAHVIRAYESLWSEQETQRQQLLGHGPDSSASRGPAVYPAVETTFAGYPSRWLDSQQKLLAAPDAAERLQPLLEAPLTDHEAARRVSDPVVLGRLLDAAANGCTLADLDAVLCEAGAVPAVARAALAWMLKYDLLRTASRSP